MGHDVPSDPKGSPKEVQRRRRKPTLEEIVKADGRYPLAAYFFVFESLDYTATLYGKNRRSPREDERHVTGQQLLEGIRRYALEQFGCLAKTVFDHFNVRTTQDFGRIVFHLVANGLMGKTDRDSLDDFKDQYDFHQAFEAGFQFQPDAKMDLTQTSPYFHGKS